MKRHPRAHRALAAIAALGIGSAILAGCGSDSTASTAATATEEVACNEACQLMKASYDVGVDLKVANRPYALCAGRSTTPTTAYTTINGNRYQIATALCPIMTGRTLYNASLQGTGVRPAGEDTIWSSFGTPDTFPQYIDGAWTMASSERRTFTSTAEPGGGMSNFFGCPCTIAEPIVVDGESWPFAECAGPMNEDTLNRPVPVGAEVTVEGPEGTFNPVGDIAPSQRKVLADAS